MKNKKLEQALPLVRKYFDSQPIKKAWLFGSYSRGDETDDSDVDILVQYDRNGTRLSLLKISCMIIDLEDILHKEVDLVEDDRLLPFARQTADKDKILIYEREN